MKRSFVFAAAVLLSGVAAPRAYGQESEWLEVRGSSTLTLRKGESTSYGIRLKKRPPSLNRAGDLVDAAGNPTDTPVAAPTTDPWFVRIRADGVVRHGQYDVDGDPNTGIDDPDTPEKEGYDLTWTPSLGRFFHGEDGTSFNRWNEWQDVRIQAHSDIDTVVVFSHEVWSNDAWCPEHGVAPVSVTVSDESDPGVRVSPTALDITEGSSDTYDVVLLRKPTGNVRISVSGPSGDVTVDKRSLTFTTQNWTVAQTVTVEAGEDADGDNDPDVTLRHSASGGGYNGVTIEDVVVSTSDNDDASTTVDLSIAPDSVREGGGRQRVTVTGELNAATRNAATAVTLTVTDGTASSPGDYSATGATLTIPAGRVSAAANVYITPVNNDLDEAGKTVHVEGSSSLAVSPSSLSVTIEDDDGPPTGIRLTASPSTVSENAGPVSIEVTARFTGGGARTDRGTVVNLSVVAGTASEPDDYTVPSTLPTLTIPRNSLEGAATFVLTVVDDEDPESAERLEVQGASDLPVDPAILTIAANDGGGGGDRIGGGGDTSTPTRAGGSGGLQMWPQDARAAENTGKMVFTVDLSGPGASPVSVRWTTANRTASAGADYTAATGTLTIPVGARSGKFEVPILDDLLDEFDEILVVRFDRPQGASLAVTEAIGTIQDNDDEPQLFIEDVSAPEGDGRLGFMVFLASDSGKTVTANYATRAVSAVADTDYRPTSGRLTIRPGGEGETLWVTVLDDVRDEEDETLELVLTGLRNAVASDLVARGTIEDDDAEPRPGVLDVKVAERSGGTEFVITLDGSSEKTITWDYRTVNGTATGGEDYGELTGTLTFRPGETRDTLPVTIVDDTIDEVDEEFHLRLTNPREASSPAVVASAVIVDDDDNAIVADAWVSRFGRTVASQVVDAVDDRFSNMNGPGSNVRLGAGPTLANPGFAARPGWMGVAPGEPGRSPVAFEAGRLLSGTSFLVQSQDEGSAGRGLEGRWTAWGRGSYTEFDGLDLGVGISGEVFNVTAGFDVETGRVIAGMALAGSIGTGGYHVARTDIQSERLGKIWSILGSVHPYVQFSLAEWLRVWGLAGIGSGTLRISGGEQDADLHMRMWAFGSRSDFRAPAAGLGLALKSDVFRVDLDSDATDVRRASAAEARRLRLMVEGSFRLLSLWGGEFTPLVEAGFREDDGAAETGRGFEVGSGFRYQNRDRGFFMEVTGRSLVSHEDERYREWGFGGTARLDPGPDNRGVAVRINSSHGAAASTVQRLWSDAGAVSYLPGMVMGRHDAEIGYGFETLRGAALVIPFSGITYSPAGAKSVRLGSRLRIGSRWMLSLRADRSRYGRRNPWYGVVLRGHLLPGTPVGPAVREER